MSPLDIVVLMNSDVSDSFKFFHKGNKRFVVTTREEIERSLGEQMFKSGVTLLVLRNFIRWIDLRYHFEHYTINNLFFLKRLRYVTD